MRGSIWRKERFIAVGWVERFLGGTQSSITQVKPNHKIPLYRHTLILSVLGCVEFQAAPSTQPTPAPFPKGKGNRTSFLQDRDNRLKKPNHRNPTTPLGEGTRIHLQKTPRRVVTI